MSDPRRHDAIDHDRQPGVETRVETLLNDGLEQYFAGHFENAIHLWTRVLFLDRHHASARAYIERARGGISERQRRAEEALQVADQLLDQGRPAEARAQLAHAVESLGEDERTAAVRSRLDRIERATGGPPRIHAVAVGPTTVERWWRIGVSVANYRVRPITALVAAGLVCVALLATSPGARARLGLGPSGAGVLAASPVLTVPVMSSDAVALTRARALYARGRLAEALLVLDRVADRTGPEQTARAEADRLRVEIQRVLLAAADDVTRQGVR